MVRGSSLLVSRVVEVNSTAPRIPPDQSPRMEGTEDATADENERNGTLAQKHIEVCSQFEGARLNVGGETIGPRFWRDLGARNFSIQEYKTLQSICSVVPENAIAPRRVDLCTKTERK